MADVAYWGLTPGWVKNPDGFSKPINARAETLEEKPSFRAAFRRKRCLIHATGFYEWKVEGRARKPFYIHPANPSETFAFAGLMEDWQEPNGEVVTSACIITSEPDALMAPIHNRMPVILPPEAWPLWLDFAAQTGELRPLLVPYPAERMAVPPVGPAVGDVRKDGPELVLPLSGGGSSTLLLEP